MSRDYVALRMGGKEYLNSEVWKGITLGSAGKCSLMVKFHPKLYGKGLYLELVLPGCNYVPSVRLGGNVGLNMVESLHAAAQQGLEALNKAKAELRALPVIPAEYPALRACPPRELRIIQQAQQRLAGIETMAAAWPELEQYVPAEWAEIPYKPRWWE